MDPDIEKHYQELLKEWKQDEDNIKDKLEKMEGKIPLKTVKTYNTNFITVLLSLAFLNG